MQILSAILRIVIGAAVLGAAGLPRLAALIAPQPAQQYLMLVLWLLGGAILGDGIWRLGAYLPERPAPAVNGK